jgi:hypothetical protein
MPAEPPPPPKMMRLCMGLIASDGNDRSCSRQGLLNGCSRHSQTGKVAFYFFVCPSCRAKADTLRMPDDAASRHSLSQYLYVP